MIRIAIQGSLASCTSAVVGLALFAVLFHFGLAGVIGIAVVTLLLLYEHLLVSPTDLRKLNAVFFTMNGVNGMVFLASVLADMWMRPGIR